jgi:hypothetical protein
MSGIHLALLGMSFGGGIPDIGAAYGGGFFAGQISTAGNGVADYNLVVAPKSSGETSKEWKTSVTSTSGTSSDIDGPGNTAAMIAAGAASHPAADFCDGLTIGGFSDWYMPAKNELEVCYYNLKPSTDSNSTGTGINPNAVPARANNYTAGTPAQTSATDFQTGNAQAFIIATPSYWSSTESSASNAWRITFDNGQDGAVVKVNSFNVRAIRRVAV